MDGQGDKQLRKYFYFAAELQKNVSPLCAVDLFFVVLGVMVTLALFTDDARKHDLATRGHPLMDIITQRTSAI